jgi:hypothetical protein
MRLGCRRPGFGTTFVDAFSADVLLQVMTDQSGHDLVAYRLYDCHGRLVADSDGLQAFGEGKEVRDGNGELLLRIPTEPEGRVEYCLYSRRGGLLTSSDGARTQLFGGIRVDGIVPKPTSRRGVAVATSTKPGGNYLELLEHSDE